MARWRTARYSGLGIAILLISSCSRGETLRAAQWRTMDVLAETYGHTDWSRVASHLSQNAGDPGNPNIVFIAVSLGNVYWNRYERKGDTADLELALDYWEWTADNDWLWGKRWLTAPLVSYLDLSLWRAHAASHLENHERIEALWEKAMEITEREADLRLSEGFPYLPYDSSATGDSKAEENAWEAALLAAAANFLPDHPHAASWDEKARQLAYDAVARPSDPPDGSGLKVTTVTENFELTNHGFYPNPTYVAATMLLLSQGALAYRLSGRPIPEEFQHNLLELYGVYRTYMDEDLRWLVPSDPDGSAALFPFAFDPELEDRATRCKADDGYLWLPTEPVAVMEMGWPLWTAVLNSKAVMFILTGSYLWHEAPVAPP